MGYGDTKIVKNSIFLKVEQGVTHTVRLLDSSPTEQWQHKIAEKLVTCTGEGCLPCMDGHSKNQRFVANVFDHTDGRVLLWSYGPNVAGALKTIAQGLEKDGENITAHDLEVSASGAGLQKKTSVQVRIKSQAVPTGIKLHKIGGGEKSDDIVPF